MSKKTNGKVLVTTAHRGVFFGTLDSRDGDTVTLTGARNCMYWTRQVRGFLGLATDGPNSECRVGPAADRIELMAVTSITQCSDVAAKAWEKAPWQS